MTDQPTLSARSKRSGQVQAGVIGGLVGGLTIWLYEAIVWVGIQHLLPLAGIPTNAVGLVFGKEFQIDLGVAAYALGTAIHFAFAAAWGVGFALLWPVFRERKWEATLAALPYALVAWVIMHGAISIIRAVIPTMGIRISLLAD